MRVFDSRIGRFFSTDPLVKKYAELTPFQFASNKPISHSDLDGKEGWEEVVAAYAIYEFLFVATAVVVTSEVIKSRSNHSTSLTYDPKKTANPWNIPLQKPPKTITSTEKPFTEPTEEPDPTEPKPPKGGSDLKKWTRRGLIGLGVATIVKEEIDKVNDAKTQQNNSQDMKNNKGTIPSVETEVPKEYLTKPIPVNSSIPDGSEQQQKFSDKPKPIQSVNTNAGAIPKSE